MSSEELRPKPTVDAAKNLELEKQIAALNEQIAEMKSAPAESYAFEPKARTPLWASLVVGVLASVSPAALTMIPMPWGPLVAIVLAGVAAGIGTHFGIKSAGVKSSSDSKS